MRTTRVKDLVKEFRKYDPETLVVVPGHDHSFRPAFVTTGFAEVTKNSITESDDDGTLVLIIEG